MTEKERSNIIKNTEKLSDDELLNMYYDSVYDSLGSQVDTMYEVGYDMVDIVERQKYEKFLGQKNDLLCHLCEKRGLKIWE